MQANGLTLIEDAGTTIVSVNASENPADLGPQDYVIVTLKAHSAIPAWQLLNLVLVTRSN